VTSRKVFKAADLVSTSFSNSRFATFSTSALCFVSRSVVRRCAVLFDRNRTPVRHSPMGHRKKHQRDHLSNFGIEHLRRLLAKRLRPVLLRSLSATIANGSNDIVHSVVRASFKRHPCDLLQVVLSTRRNVSCSKENLLRYPTTQSHTYPVHHLRG
jgi:hypothetical protein